MQVFGSLGPICESHRPELFKEFLESEGEKGVTNHFRAMAQALLYGGCDGLLLETMNSWKEVGKLRRPLNPCIFKIHEPLKMKLYLDLQLLVVNTIFQVISSQFKIGFS